MGTPTSSLSMSGPSLSSFRPNQLDDRNVHIIDDRDQSEIAGFYLTQGMTASFVYKMLDICLVARVTPNHQPDGFGGFTGFYSLISKSGGKLERSDDTFRPGRYRLISQCGFSLTSEAPLIRLVSHHPGTRTESFTEAVYSRDDHCIISGKKVPRKNYNSFYAVHVIPLAHEATWIAEDYSRYLATLPESGGSINSVQNGLLLSAHVRQLFNSYALTIDPETWTVIGLSLSARPYAGRKIDQNFINDSSRPPNELLYWHFRQAVLTKMKGVGEPTFEFDFQSGDDILGDIHAGPRAAERMEFELFGRFAAQMDIFSLS